jgi:hypothetical protein
MKIFFQLFQRTELSKPSAHNLYFPLSPEPLKLSLNIFQSQHYCNPKPQDRLKIDFLMHLFYIDIDKLNKTYRQIIVHYKLTLMSIQSKPLQQLRFSLHLHIIGLAVVLFAPSCGVHKKSIGHPSALRLSRHADVRVIEQCIRKEFKRWEGTPHRLGGTTRRGIDCSAFVKVVYKNIFDIDLPRTTIDQVQHGHTVHRHELRAGDLIFFKPPTYPRHVGILLGPSEFVHASKSQGVTISQIKPYWNRYYWTARRILSQSEDL